MDKLDALIFEVMEEASGAQLGKYYYNGRIFYLFQEIQIPLMTISKDDMQKQI